MLTTFPVRFVSVGATIIMLMSGIDSRSSKFGFHVLNIAFIEWKSSALGSFSNDSFHLYNYIILGSLKSDG